jgi:hypothetical protein
MRFLLVIVFCVFKLNASCLELDTARVYLLGGNGNEVMYKAIPTNDTGFFMVGTTGSFGEYFTSVYAIKLDSLGNKVWSNTYGINQINYAYSALELSSGNKFICGYSYDSLDYNGTLYKIDVDGNLIFSKQIGGLDWDFIYDIKQLDENKLVLCGNTFSNSSSYGNGYIVCVDTMGTVLWENQFNNENYETYLKSVCIYNGSIYSVGKVKNSAIEKYVIYKVSADGSETLKFIDESVDGSYLNKIISVSAGQLAAVGVKKILNSDGNFNHEIMLCHFNENLNLQSTLMMVGENTEEGSDLIQLTTGELSIIGFTNTYGGGGFDVSQYRCSELGEVVFTSSTYGNLGDDKGMSLCLNKRNRIVFCGSSNSLNYNAINDDALWIVFKYPNVESAYFQINNHQIDNLNPTAINNSVSSKNELKVFNNSVEIKGKYSYILSTFDGKMICEGSFNDRFILPNTAHGLYILKVFNKDVNYSKKILK